MKRALVVASLVLACALAGNARADARTRDSSAELQFVYAKRLLVVMPNGFGVSWKGHTVAVARLAAASGVEVTAAPAPAPSGGGHRRLPTIAAAPAALALAVLAVSRYDGASPRRACTTSRARYGQRKSARSYSFPSIT
jgi:hypothetical protein